MGSWMLSKNEIERYRRLGPERRFQIFLDLANEAWKDMNKGDKDFNRRRWKLILQQHDESSRRLEKKFRELSKHASSD